jgi:hypothetical protein
MRMEAVNGRLLATSLQPATEDEYDVENKSKGKSNCPTITA